MTARKARGTRRSAGRKHGAMAPVGVTADTITAEQIRALLDEARATILACESAVLPGALLPRGAVMARRDAREACAAAWNARHGGTP